jgi:Concanavalin A-like lectin/glucanases superfamily
VRSVVVPLLCAGLPLLACTLTTDLGGYAGPGETPREAGAGADAASDGATAEASTPDANVAADYGAVVMADGPAAYFRLDEPAGAATARDETGGPAAAPSGKGVRFGEVGPSRGAAHFDGADVLDVGDRLDFDGLVPFTIEVWVKPDAGTWQGELVKKRDQSKTPFAGYVLYLGGNGGAQFEGWGTNVELSAWTDGALGAAPARSGFHHLVAVVTYVDGKGNAAVYVDGARTGKGGFDNTTPLPGSGAPLRIGGGFVGLLDEVALYAKALSPERIRAHYEAGR